MRAIVAPEAGSYSYAGTGYANPHAVSQIANAQSTTTYSYDQNGNISQKTTDGVTTTYLWDYANRLIALGSGGATSTYGYDAFGSRVLQTTATSTTIYPFKWYSVASSTGSGAKYATTTEYVFNGDTLVSTIDQQFASGTATGTPQTLYIHPDHLGSTNVITNASGTVVTTKDYYHYGSMRVNSGSASLARGYIGQFADQSNLSYFEARYYEPTRGQFLSQDPTYLAVGNPAAVKGLSKVDQNVLLTDPQALNSYSYALNNPIKLKDKNGKFIDIPWISNSQWAQESATAAYQQSSAWRFAMDRPNTTAAIVGISSLPALLSGGSAAAAFQMAAYPGVGATFAAQQAFAGTVYSALALDSTFEISGVVGQFGQLNTRQPTSIFGPAASMAGVGISAWGGYPGAISDAYQFAGLMSRTLGSAASNLYSNSVDARRDTSSSFNAKTGGGGSRSAPSNNSLWVTPSGAVITFGGQVVSPPPSK